MTMEEVKDNSAKNQAVSDVGLSSTHLPEDSNNKTENLTADRLLDELPEPQHQTAPVANDIMTSPTNRDNYDQFFEEVSLDLPTNTTEDSETRNNNTPTLNTDTSEGSNSDSSSDYRNETSSQDLSGPFYSISEVLDDINPSPESIMHNPRAARRNVNEAEVIVTAGGSSMPVKPKSSLNIFRHKSSSHKPTPLESVISKTRPRMLPPKNPLEEKKHLQEYEAMMKKAKKLELQKQKENDKKREQKERRQKHALYVWEKTIIPNWESKFNQPRTVVLWNQGIPARCRKAVWSLRIGNPLKITNDTFNECARRLPQYSKKSTMDESHGVPMPILSSNHDPYMTSLYSIGKHPTTSSLDVLQGRKNEDENEVSSSHSLNSDSTPRSMDVEEESAIDFGSNSSHVEDIGLEDDIGDDDSTSQDEEDDDSKVIKNVAAINYLNKEIDEDILRTLPSLCVFQPDGPMFNSLRKILHAYVGYRSNMTYTRGTSFLAGVLLLNMDSQDAFISLVNLIDRSQILSAYYYADSKRVHGYYKIFNVLFAENLPKLYLHFKNLTLTPENYLPDWFMTIFASIIPLELSSRLWDLYLLHGDIIMFRTALTVLKLLEPLLWGGGFSETVKILNMGFVGEHRGEEVKAALAVSGSITEGDEDPFFDEVLGRKGVHLDKTKFRELLDAHMPK